MTNIERVRQYLLKASFANESDRYSALECLHEIAQACGREDQAPDEGDGVGRLLPCPFCGGEAYRHVRNDILTVGCNNCSISFANHARFGCVADTEWNRRSNS